METEFITPISAWGNIGDIGSIGGTNGQKYGAQSSGQLTFFSDVFKSAVDQVRETQADVEYKQYLLSTGQIDDAHTLPIAEAKAGLAVDVLITLRNKALESYNELIKINI